MSDVWVDFCFSLLTDKLVVPVYKDALSMWAAGQTHQALFFLIWKIEIEENIF